MLNLWAYKLTQKLVFKTFFLLEYKPPQCLSSKKGFVARGKKVIWIEYQILFAHSLLLLFHFVLASLGRSCSMPDLHLGMRLSLWMRCEGSVLATHGLSCPVACGILDPWPGIKPIPPTLEGTFLTTGPPGKSLPVLFNCKMLISLGENL